jgi:hypothetical protein
MATVTNSTVRQELDTVTRPDPLTYAPKILCWILFWPWNLAWSVCVNNPFRYTGHVVVKLIRSTFEEISTGEFKNIEAELSLDQSVTAPAAPVVPTALEPVSVAPIVAVQPPREQQPEVEQQANEEPSSTEDFEAIPESPAPPKEDEPVTPTHVESPPVAPQPQTWSAANLPPNRVASGSSLASDPRAQSRVLPSGTSPDTLYVESDVTSEAEPRPTPDPLLYIKQESDRPTHSATQPDPWFTKTEPKS